LHSVVISHQAQHEHGLFKTLEPLLDSCRNTPTHSDFQHVEMSTYGKFFNVELNISSISFTDGYGTFSGMGCNSHKNNF